MVDVYEEFNKVRWYIGPKDEDLVFSEESAEGLRTIFDTTLKEDEEVGFENAQTQYVYLSLLTNEATPLDVKLKVLSVLEEHFDVFLLAIGKKEGGEYHRILNHLIWVAEVDPSEEVRAKAAKLLELL